MQEMKHFLDEKVQFYNTPAFIASDPISIPHRFENKHDIEIAGLYAAIFAWGQRKAIIAKCNDLLLRMDNTPSDFVMNAGPNELERLNGFVHRTFNESDCLFSVESLRIMYAEHGGLEDIFTSGYKMGGIKKAISVFRDRMLEPAHFKRFRKHISDPESGSAAKRINMFLRWMVRNDDAGVDFGLWKQISPAHLMCPLDLHSGRVARELGLLTRSQNDWKAVEELTTNLIKFDANDPVKYDFALFGTGINEKLS
jgi:uncharacterized protein (TIGR02757 family)